MTIEGHTPNPLGDWSGWLDGRPRRLKRGQDYTGDAKPVVQRAKDAAAQLGKTVVASRDQSGKYEYLWVQFVDGEIERGEPCPICGGTTLEKTQKFFLRCSVCGSTLKAMDDWEVVAGSFPMGPRERTERQDLEVQPAANDYAEMLGGRALSARGVETRTPKVNEDFALEATIRFLRPVDWAMLRFRLQPIRLQSPEPLHAQGPQIVDVRVHIPARLLVPRLYVVDAFLIIFPDRARPDQVMKLADRELITFELRRLETSDGSYMEAEFGSPLDWSVSVRRGESDPVAPVG